MNIKSFEAKGPSQVVVHMTAPYAFLPGVMPWLPIVSPQALASHSTTADPHAQKWFASNAAGTGPYMLTSFNPNSRIDLGQNTHYWQPWMNGTPTGGSLTLNANVTTQLELLQQGQVDFLGAISPDNAEQAQKMSNVVLLVQPGLEVQTMPLNITKPPLDNPKVRQALIKAFDYEAFLKFNKGFGQMANSPIPPGFPGYDSSLPMPKQDLAAAKQLLDAAGVQERHDDDLCRRAGARLRVVRGAAMQTALGKLGIKLQVQTPPWPVPATIMSKPSTAADITFLNISANTNDPSAILREPCSSANIASKGGYNWSYYQNPAVDKGLRPSPRRAQPSRAARQEPPEDGRRRRRHHLRARAQAHRAGREEVAEREVRCPVQRQRRPLVLHGRPPDGEVKG